jgi:hypothetical protein
MGKLRRSFSKVMGVNLWEFDAGIGGISWVIGNIDGE